MSNNKEDKTSTKSVINRATTKKDPYHVASSDGPHLILMIVQLKDNIKDNDYDE